MRAEVKHFEAVFGTGDVIGVDACSRYWPCHAGALRVMEQLIGIVAANGVFGADLRGRPTDVTTGMLDDEAMLCLRSD